MRGEGRPRPHEPHEGDPTESLGGAEKDEPHEGNPRATSVQWHKLPITSVQWHKLPVVDPEFCNTLWAGLSWVVTSIW